MSTSTNTNYAPPPQGQLNMMNGMPPTITQQQQMQQILQQKQQLSDQQMQQHQSLLQQTTSNSSTLPTAMFNNNMMSKFMPPNLSSPSTSIPTSLPVATPQTSNINGPLSNAKTSHQMLSNNNLPAHLRPPNMSYITTAGNTTLTNGINGSMGTNGGASTNSSRTASPALQSPQQSQITPTTLQQQQYQQHLRATSQAAINSSANLFPLNANLPPSVTSNITTLSNNMQNLNLQHNSGPTATIPANLSQTSQPIFQNQHQQLQHLPAVNSSSKITAVPPMPQLKTTFKTSALNAPDVVPLNSTTINANKTPISTHPSSMFGTNKPQVVGPSAAAVQSTYGNQTNQLPPSIPLATTTTIGGGSGDNKLPIKQPPPIKTTTSAYMPTPPISGNMPPTTGGFITSPQLSTSSIVPAATTTTTSSSGVGVFNNSLQQQQQQQFPPRQELQQPIGINQQKRLYPQQTLLPPMPIGAPAQQQQQQQQQQQYAYSQAYQQQQQQQYPGAQPGARSMFNGQTNSGPLQYQNQNSMQQQQYPGGPQQQQQQQQQPNILQHGFSRLWGQDTIDLMQNRHILTPATLSPPKVVLHNQFHESINCNPSIMRCTVAKIPESNSLLQKSRLPLGILIHPFRDINSLPVIQCPNIVRCRLCRTYINPFVYFVDSKMWKCNLCYRVNELPDDFQFDPATKTYGDVTRRPEVRSSTIEFIAPSEYMLRPPQPAIYLFLFDVSIIAQQCGYLENVCTLLSKHLEDMPGDARAQVGFIAYNSNVHFYSMADGYSQPHEMTLLDIDDVFLPRPDNLLVNLKECKELIKDLLTQLPKRFADTHDPGSALGAALQVAYKLMQASGGRVTVFQTCLPNKGPGSLEPREDPNNRSAKDVAHLNPATDFYKRYALECSGYQIAVDLFLLNQQYSDIATISGISKHSGGCVHHIPLYQKTKLHNVETLKNCLKRYLTRKIGFEAVMRIRCTRGLQVHTFHGNFFVRSTDLLSLPNVNPDAGYGMQISYEESLSDVKTICFQAALLYTNSEGERRIRVHTLCLPVTASLPEVMHSADTEAIIGLLTKMAVDRSITSNIADAREAFMNATVDILNAFKIAQNLPSGQTGQLVAPRSLALMPLYILALLKHPAFRVGTSTRLDDRVYAMDCMKTLPLDQLMKYVYPEFYNVDVLFYNAQNANATTVNDDDDDDDLPDVPRLQLSAEYLDSRSMFLLDCGTLIILYVGLNVPVHILENVLGIKATAELPDYYYSLPTINSFESDALKRFIMRLNDEKPYQPIVQIIRDTSTAKPQFIEKLVDDRSESSLSYYEFLQHIRTQVK